MAPIKMPSAKQILSAATSTAASGMIIRSFAKDLLSADPCEYLSTNLLPIFLSETTIVIEEFRGLNKNNVFEAVDIYLGTKLTPKTRRFKVGQDKNEKKMAVMVDKNQTITDSFEGALFTWRLVCLPVRATYVPQGKGSKRDINSVLKSEVRSYELTFHQSYRGIVLESYLNYIMKKSQEIKEEDKAIKLHTVDYRRWDSTPINLGHPMTFDTLALDYELKQSIMEDLDNFVNEKEFYKRIGKAWKRGYLLYGPPGTGKSSLVAAMANYLNYDIFDLDLTECEYNSDLKALLLAMANRCILVLEDIDCTIKLLNREAKENSKSSKNDDDASKVTLSGLLNFIDGLWSCCGEERIIVFTTNHKERLDPALLRPGRMDMHIHMSYCTFSAFKQLAFNYLELFEHELFGQIEELIAKVEVTPAEVAGELIKNPDREVSLRGLVKFLENRIEEQEKAKKEGDKKAEQKKAKKQEKKGEGGNTENVESEVEKNEEDESKKVEVKNEEDESKKEKNEEDESKEKEEEKNEEDERKKEEEKYEEDDSKKKEEENEEDGRRKEEEIYEEEEEIYEEVKNGEGTETQRENVGWRLIGWAGGGIKKRFW